MWLKVIENDEMFVVLLVKYQENIKVLEENGIKYATIFNSFHLLVDNQPTVLLWATNMPQTSLARQKKLHFNS